MMTINNKRERNEGGKCLGWPGTSCGPVILPVAMIEVLIS